MELRNLLKWSSLVLVLWLMIMLTFYMIAPKRVVGYSVGGSTFSDNIFIRVDIENYEDDKIDLKNITYQEAVELVERLNATLK